MAKDNVLSFESLDAQNKELAGQLAESNTKVEELATQLAESNTKVDELATQLAESNTKVDELATQLAELNNKVDELVEDTKSAVEKIVSELKSTGGSAIVVNEVKVAPELSKKPYKVGKEEFMARYPRIQVGDTLYTSEELHEAPNEEVLAELVAEFKKGNNTFFEKVKS